MRLSQLDGLRGLAALQVVIGHMAIFSGPLATAIDGNSAVMMFFVLSGFCLALPYVEGRRLHLGEYAVKRIFRLYPALLLSALVVLVCGRLFDPAGSQASPLAEWAGWGRAGWSAAEVLRYVALVWPGTNYMNFNPVLWSLVVEVHISAVMPLILLGLAPLGGRAALLACGLIEAASTALGGWSEPVSAELRWIGLFMLGAILARHRRLLVERLAAAPRLTLALGLLGAVFYVLPNFLFSPYTQYHFLALATGSASACLILVALASPRCAALMGASLPQFLGTVSYSLYLLHFPIALAVFSTLFVPYGGAAAAGVTVALSLALAAASAQWVEKPSSRLGARLGARLRFH